MAPQNGCFGIGFDPALFFIKREYGISRPKTASWVCIFGIPSLWIANCWMTCACLMKHVSPPSSRLSKAEALEAIPVKNDHLEEERLPDGVVLIRYPAVPARSMIANLVRRIGGGGPSKVRIRKIQLDRLGTEVWEMMDNQRSVKEIIAGFAERHQLSQREAEISITQFVRMLGQKGLIGLKAPS